MMACQSCGRPCSNAFDDAENRPSMTALQIERQLRNLGLGQIAVALGNSRKIAGETVEKPRQVSFGEHAGVPCPIEGHGFRSDALARSRQDVGLVVAGIVVVLQAGGENGEAAIEALRAGPAMVNVAGLVAKRRAADGIADGGGGAELVDLRQHLGLGEPFELVADGNPIAVEQIKKGLQLAQRQRVGRARRHGLDDLGVDRQVVTDDAVLVEAYPIGARHARHRIAETGKEE